MAGQDDAEENGEPVHINWNQQTLTNDTGDDEASPAKKKKKTPEFEEKEVLESDSSLCPVIYLITNFRFLFIADPISLRRP